MIAVCREIQSFLLANALSAKSRVLKASILDTL